MIATPNAINKEHTTKIVIAFAFAVLIRHDCLIVSYRISSNCIYRDDRDISHKYNITEIYRRRLNCVNDIYPTYLTNPCCFELETLEKKMVLY